MFSEGQPPAVPDHLRCHDARFEGGRILDNAVRMDAALVREDILADNRLDGQDADAGEPGDESRGLDQPFFLYPGLYAVYRLHDHHGLGKVGIAGPFPETVDGHLHLRGTGFDSGDRVCDREAEVIVAVDIDGALTSWLIRVMRVFIAGRRDDADRIRHVDDRGPGICGGPGRPR